MAPLFLLALGTILVAAAATLPWWTVTRTVTSTYSPTYVERSFWSLGVVCDQGLSGQPLCVLYSAGHAGAIADTFALVTALVGGAMALGVLAILMFILSASAPRFRIGVLVTCVLGCLTTFGAPAYLYAVLPGAVTHAMGNPPTFSGLFGTAVTGDAYGYIDWAWAAGAGWYMAFAACASFVGATLLVFLESRNRLRLRRLSKT